MTSNKIPLDKMLLTLGVALDENYSDKFIGSLSRAGYNVVYVAKHGQPDEEWLDQALKSGASIVYSKDLDIPLYLERWGFDDVIWIEEQTLPHELQEIEKRVQSYLNQSERKDSNGSDSE